MKKIEIFLAVVICILSFSSCAPKDEYDEKQIFAMDTVITIKVEKGRGDDVFDGCAGIITEAERIFSRTLEDSEVTRFNTSNSEAEYDSALDDCSAPFVELIEKSLDISEKTGGAFDITIEPLVELWNITGESPEVPDVSYINNALVYVGYERMYVEDDTVYRYGMVKIDMGAIAKGYTLGMLCDYLGALGVKYANISFGGNVGLVGSKPSGGKWSVGIKDPDDTSSTVGTLTLDGGYVAVSGDYERYFEKDGTRYHHIIDPFTGYPAQTDIRSVAVVCDDASLADGLSTALFVMGYDKALAFYNAKTYDFEAVFVTDDGVYTTEGIKDSFQAK